MNHFALLILMHPYSVAATIDATISQEETDRAELVAALAPWLRIDANDQAEVRRRMRFIARKTQVANDRELFAKRLIVVAEIDDILVCRDVRPDEIFTARGGQDRRRSTNVDLGPRKAVITSGHRGTTVRRAVRVLREEEPMDGQHYVLATSTLAAKRELIASARTYQPIGQIKDELAKVLASY